MPPKGATKKDVPKRPSTAKKCNPSPAPSAKVKELEKQLADYKAEILILRGKFDPDAIKHDIVTAWAVEVDYVDTIKRLEIDLQKATRGQSLNADSANLQKKLDESNANVKIYAADIRTKDDKIKHLEQENHRLEQEKIQNDNLKGKLPTQDDFQSESKKLNTDKSNNGDLHNGIEEAKKETSDLKKQMETELKKQMETSAKELKKLQERINEYETKCKSHLEENTELKTKVNTLETKLKSAEKEKNQQSQPTAAPGKLDDDSKSKEKIKQLNHEIESLNSQFTELKSDKTRIARENEELNKKLESIKQERDKLQADNQQLKQQAQQQPDASQRKPSGDNSAEEARLKKELEEEKRKCEKLEAAKSDLEKTCHGAFEKLDKKEKEIKALTDTHKKAIDNKENTINSLRKESSIVDPAADSTRVELKELKSNHAQTTTKLHEVTEECDRLRVRLSKMAGDQLMNNNANITDLSDENRPTKLGERYSELYDNEWTDAFEENEKDQGSEEKCVKYLYTMLQEIHTFCQKLSKDQSDKLKKFVRTIPESNSKNTPTSDIPVAQLRMLKDIRKSFANDQVDDVMQHYIDTKKPKLDGKPNTKTYVRSCVEVCWLMSVQDPPVIINDKITSGAFDGDLFRSYTKTGKQLAYVVWPPLLLHENGAMLSKGVAQGK